MRNFKNKYPIKNSLGLGILISVLILTQIKVSSTKNMKKIMFKRSDNDMNQNFDGNGKNFDDEMVTKMRLNQKFDIACPLLNKNNFSFQYILFNNSIFNAIKYYYPDKYENENIYFKDSNTFLNVKSKSKFDLIFDQTEIISYERFFKTDRVNAKNSGRYYCVYLYIDNLVYDYFVYNHLYLVFDEKVIFSKFNDTIQLAPMKYDKSIIEENQFEWFYDDKTHSLDSYLSLNEENELIIELKDMRLFDTMFRSQNTINGAFLNYIIECLDCRKFSHAPIMTPLKQIATVGSDIIFTCDKPFDSVEPERFMWFKKENEFKKKELYNSNSNGQILKLDNVNLTDSGWYMCCIFYYATSFTQNYVDNDVVDDNYYYHNENSISSKHRNHHFKLKRSLNMTCSSAQLIVNDSDYLKNSNDKTINKEKSNMELNVKTHFSNIIILYLAIFLMLFFIIFFIFSFNFKLKQKFFNRNYNTDDDDHDYCNSATNITRYQLAFNKNAETLNISTAKLTYQNNLDP